MEVWEITAPEMKVHASHCTCPWGCLVLSVCDPSLLVLFAQHGGFCLGSIQVPSQCLLLSNKWPCLQFLGCSLLMKPSSSGFMCWVIMSISITPYGTHLLQDLSWKLGTQFIYWWLMRIRIQYRWGTRPVRASPGQVLTPAAAFGTGHLVTRNSC
jgi:hypothetical protein